MGSFKNYIVTGFVLIFWYIPFKGHSQFQEHIKSDTQLLRIENQIKISIDSTYILTEELLKSNDLSIEETKWLYTTLALVHQLRGDGYRATLDLEEAKKLTVEDEFLIAYTLYVDALISIEISNESLALEAILEAIDIFNKQNNKEFLASCYTVLSKVYYNLEKPDEAIVYLQKALSIHIQSNNTKRIAGDYHNLAIHILPQNPDSSLLLLNQAIEMNQKSGNERWIANNYYMKSKSFLTLQKLDSSFYYMRKAVNLYQRLHDKTSELSSRSEIGHLHYSIKELDSAKLQYKYVINETKLQSNHIDLSGVYKNLSDIYFKESQFDSSRAYTHLYIHTRDSISKKKNQNILSIVTLRNKFQLQKDELVLENDRIKLSGQRKNTLIIALIILIIMISFFIYNIYRWKKLDKKKSEVDAQLMHKEIELKNKELTLAVLGQLKQTKSLDKLEDQLTQIEEKAPKKLKPELQKLISEVSRDNGPLLWKEFELRFNHVHNDFYKRLKEHAPDLTPAEIKVCSFLKLGLNSKEISALLFKTPASIEVDRARIRKKLGLTKSKTNLTHYIFDI